MVGVVQASPLAAPLLAVHRPSVKPRHFEFRPLGFRCGPLGGVSLGGFGTLDARVFASVKQSLQAPGFGLRVGNAPDAPAVVAYRLAMVTRTLAPAFSLP